MEYTNLGNSGLKISKVVLGCMSFGTKQWAEWVEDDKTLIFSILQAAYDAGLRTWDTADMYSNGVSEELIGEFLEKNKINRSTVTILSKCWAPIDDDPSAPLNELNLVNRSGLSRKHIFDAVDASTKRLGTYMDLLQIHRFDPDTPIEETMKALHDVVESGKVRYIGASSMRAIEFAQMQFCAEKNGWTKFISMQNYHNLLYREEEREMIPFCKQTGLGMIPWSPIARGKLAKPLDAEMSVRANTDNWLDDEKAKQEPQLPPTAPTFPSLKLMADDGSSEEIINRVEKVAKETGYSMAQVSTAWSLSKGMNPTVGISSIKRLNELIETLKVKLTDEQVRYLEEPYRARAVTGHVEF